jgi:hypothetical protein
MEWPCGRPNFEINVHFPLEGRQPGCQGDHSPPCNDDIKNKWTPNFSLSNSFMACTGTVAPLHMLSKDAAKSFDDDPLCQTQTAAKCSLSAEKAYTCVCVCETDWYFNKKKF